MNKTFYPLNGREHATVLAALRYWQREGLMSGGHEHDIASNGDSLDPLTLDEINGLCERLNFGGSFEAHAEVIADLATNMAAARDDVKPDDSRQVVNEIIAWADEFEKKHENTDWAEHGDYIGAVDAFFVDRFIETYGVHPFEKEDR